MPPYFITPLIVLHLRVMVLYKLYVFVYDLNLFARNMYSAIAIF